MRWLKRLAWITVIVAAVAMAASMGGFLWYRQTSQPVVEGEMEVAGLRGKVTITRDSDAVPRIEAADPLDAYFGLGFVHAQDRLWQMQMNKRIAAGRLAEILGVPALDTDRFLRTLGVRRNAEAILASSTPETRAALQAYADGVNAGMASRRGPLPPEFTILRTRPEKWEPVDSLAWQTMMAWDLGGNWSQETLRMRLSQALPLTRINELLAPYPGERPLRTMDYPALYRHLAPLSTAMAKVDAIAPPGYVEGMGSNNWVVSGAHTQTGKPMLANDPHLGLQAPALWYFAAMRAPGLDVTGATLPGMPLVVLGHTPRFAWGFTNTAPDVQDLFIERVRPGRPHQYQTPQGWVDFTVRDEVIHVKDGADVTLRVRETRHGPVISDVAEPVAQAAAPLGAQYVVAFQWTALRPDDRTLEAGLKLNRATDWSGFREALRDFHAPQQNIVYADVDGNIAFIAPGRVPRRTAANDLKGLAPAPGWDARYDWQGFIPFEQLPQQFNPREGVIVTANQKIVADDYPYFLTSEWTVPYRHDRIRQLLAGRQRHTMDSFAAIQADVLSLAVKDALPILLSSAAAQDPSRPPRERQVFAALAQWDGTMDAGRFEPLVATAWLRELSRTLFEDKVGDGVFMRMWEQRNVQQPMLNILRSPRGLGRFWCDDSRTPTPEDCNHALTVSWDRAFADLQQRYGDDPKRWRWGQAHAARSEHKPFSRVPSLAGFFNVRVPTGGDTYTVNVGRHNLRDESAPFESVHAASLRAIYDLADLPSSRFISSTGQSGSVLSSHYRDWTERWARGEYVTLSGGAGKGAGNGAEGGKADVRTLVLTPAKAGQ
ncbi:penicillin amidase [Cupriavidus gilardii J11]|uniref:Penicillin amidase n=1 Tax=Cupriavidus gilardii J11 TaxID=936133 RepID=A0A562B3L1_9BURK|nr:penicillin acylase family protein [Cupriavidus gilardii]TWG79761.1 penicillin amidase [Cupriavidus gilardii J11]